MVSTIVLEIHFTDCKVIEGKLITSENWHLVTKFCFMDKEGTFEYDVQYDMEYEVQNINFYHDAPYQWGRISGGKTNLVTCKDKESTLERKNNQMINLTERVITSGCNIIKKSNEIVKKSATVLRCTGKRTFNTIRDRYWYIVISNCDSTKGLNIRYKFKMTNGKKSDIFSHHFSADQNWTLQILIGSSIIDIFLTSFAFFLLGSPKEIQSHNIITRTYAFAVAAHFAGCLVQLLHYLQYAKDGIEKTEENWKYVAVELSRATSHIACVFVTSILASGYVSRKERIDGATLIITILSNVIYLAGYAVYLINETYHSNHQEHFSIIDQEFAQYSFMAINVLVLITLTALAIVRGKLVRDMMYFHGLFITFCIAWFGARISFLAFPENIIGVFEREKVFMLCEHIHEMFGHVFLLALLWISAYANTLCYKISTNRVAVMDSDYCKKNRYGSQSFLTLNQNKVYMHHNDVLKHPYIINIQREKSLQITQEFNYTPPFVFNNDKNNLY